MLLESFLLVKKRRVKFKTQKVDGEKKQGGLGSVTVAETLVSSRDEYQSRQCADVLQNAHYNAQPIRCPDISIIY